jgi:hypothetical protein
VALDLNRAGQPAPRTGDREALAQGAGGAESRGRQCTKSGVCGGERMDAVRMRGMREGGEGGMCR